MVAAWMSAETGVGPAIASPSQDCSGNCADLPHAASSSMRPIAVSVPSLARRPTPLSTVAKSTAPNVANMSPSATSRPMSPTRLATNAFFAATAYGGAVVPEPDEQVRREAHALPADEQQQVAVREHERRASPRRTG